VAAQPACTGIAYPVRAVLTAAAGLVVVKVTLAVVIGYRDYLPPNFQTDFLLGREKYFWGSYVWAFYAHLVAGPTTLLLGTILVSERFRKFAPRWHKRLGRVQGITVLLFLAPSGLWMACYAVTGAVAGMGLGTLAIATAACALWGWRSAVARQFVDHRRWMWRMYLLLCSAVVIRLIGGLATLLGIDALWLYPLSAWGSWLVPLLIYEVARALQLPPAAIAAREQSLQRVSPLAP
jgi:hypothetical protein